MRLYTAEEMSRADKGAQALGIPGGFLMERAGVGMARIALEVYAPGRALVVSGGGNNGGDGFVIARELHLSGVEVAVLATREEYEGDPGTNFEVLRNLGVRLLRSEELEAELGRAGGGHGLRARGEGGVRYLPRQGARRGGRRGGHRHPARGGRGALPPVDGCGLSAGEYPAYRRARPQVLGRSPARRRGLP